MLNKQELKFLTLLSELLVEDEKFKIVELSELESFCKLPKDKISAVLDKLTIENCVSVKYADGEEVCLCVTTRGRTAIEDSKVIDLDSVDAETKIKFNPAKQPEAVIQSGEAKFAVPIGAKVKIRKRSGKVVNFFLALIASFIGSFAAGVAIVMMWIV